MNEMAVETTLTSEEKDHLDRSTNKVDPEGGSTIEVQETPVNLQGQVQAANKGTFRDMLMKGGSAINRESTMLDTVVW
ncbi:hypothetical protein COLO4_00492 [Corchorus olitorius]|uniref:Uncharacterized protein n=1 Tax=Corchorus olitorius TaxID=93759 RepID=A0A1R3L3X8_9ROSI|nr:hypothetical protein COLO4_00492 [Corchorus olitorius]